MLQKDHFGHSMETRLRGQVQKQGAQQGERCGGLNQSDFVVLVFL
jgi:hypothetical protein